MVTVHPHIKYLKGDVVVSLLLQTYNNSESGLYRLNKTGLSPLFLLDSTQVSPLARLSKLVWSPNGRLIAFHYDDRPTQSPGPIKNGLYLLTLDPTPRLHPVFWETGFVSVLSYTFGPDSQVLHYETFDYQKKLSAAWAFDIHKKIATLQKQNPPIPKSNPAQPSLYRRQSSFLSAFLRRETLMWYDPTCGQSHPLLTVREPKTIMGFDWLWPTADPLF